MAPTKTEVFVEAVEKGFNKVTADVNKLTEALANLGNRSPRGIMKVSEELRNLQTLLAKQTNTLNDLTSGLGRLTTKLDQTAVSAQNAHKRTSLFGDSILSMKWSIASVIGDMEKMLAVQLRWFAARAVLTAVSAAPVAALAPGVTFLKDIDYAEAQLRRYGAAEGQAKEKYTAEAKEVAEMAVQFQAKLGLSFDEIVKSADRLLAAGVKIDVVKNSLETFTKLQIAYPEIEMNRFTTSIIGILNTFRESAGLAQFDNDADKLKAILDKVAAALRIGVIAPGDIGVVIQHLGQMSQAAGFSIDQMMALSVMITNLGSKAGSAGRLLAGFLNTLSGPKAREELAKIGIQLDQTKTLAEQFETIMQGVTKVIGTGATKGMTLGGLSFLTSLTTAERTKILQSLVRDLGSYQEYMAKISSSAGEVDRVHAEMDKSIAQTWDKLVGSLKLASKEMVLAITSSEDLKNFLQQLADIVKVLAGNKEGFEKLGEGGKTAVGAITLLKNVLGTLWEVVNPLLLTIGGVLGVVVQITGAISDSQTAISLLTAAIMGLITAWLVPFIATHGPALVAAISGLIIKVTAAVIEFTGLNKILGVTTITAGTFGTTLLTKTNVAIAAVTLAVSGILLLFQHLNSEMDKSDQRDQAFAKLIAGSKVGDIGKLQGEVNVRKNRIAALQATLDKSGIYGLTQAEHDELTNTRNEVAVLEKRIANLKISSVVKPAEKDAKTPPSQTAPKELRSLKSQISSTMELYRGQLRTIRTTMDEAVRLEQDRFRLGEISAKDYYAAVENYALAYWNAQQKAITEWNSKVNAEYSTLIAKTKDPFERKALDAAWTADIEAMKVKVAESQKVFETTMSKTRREARIADYNQERIMLEGGAARVKESYLLQESLLRQSLDARQQLMETQYALGKMSTYEYYKAQEDFARRDYEIKKNLIEQEYTVQRKLLTDKRDFLVEEKQIYGEEYQKLLQSIATLDTSKATNLAKAQADLMKNLLGISGKTATDPSAVFEGKGGGIQGFFAVWDMAFDQNIRKFEDWGTRIKGIVDETFSSMADAFETLFMDTMKNELKSAEEYVVNFLIAIRNTLIKDVAKTATGGLMSFIKTIPANFFHEGGVVGSGGSTGFVNPMVFAYAPRLHSGLASDEFPAILQKGETVLPRGYTQSDFSDVQVNIINQTSQPIAAGNATMKLDMKTLIANVIIRDKKENGVISKALGR